MGCYINPPDMTKEQWLFKHAAAIPPNTLRAWDTKPEGTLPVILVDNGSFTAAGIAYNKAEYDAFNVEDGRDRLWFCVPQEELLEVAPDLKYYLEPELHEVVEETNQGE